MPKDEELKEEEEQEDEEELEGEEEEPEHEEKKTRAEPRAARRAAARAARKERKRREKKEPRSRRVMREQIVEGLSLQANLAPVFALLGTGSALGGLIWWVITRTFKWPVVTLLAVGGVLLIVALAARFQDVVAFVRHRATLSSVNTGVAVLLVLGIMVIANYLAMRKINVKWDATQDKLFSMSQQTRKVVQGLEKKVEFGGFYVKDSPYSQAPMAREIFDQYDELSPKLTAAVHDPRLDKDKVQEWNITSANVTIVRCGDRREEVYTLSEQNLTNAILEVVVEKRPKLYFLQGHGEKVLELGAEEADSYSAIKGRLESQQYEVATLNLAASGDAEPTVPEDCDVLVVLGPKYPLDPREVNAINNYLTAFSVERRQTGRALIGLAPPPAPDLREILQDWGVTPAEGMIVDFAQNFFGYVSMPLVMTGEPHEITREFPGGGKSMGSYMTLPRPLHIDDEPEPYPEYQGAPPPPPKKAIAVMSSLDTSWAETGPLSAQSQRDGTEEGGPIPVLVVVDGKMGEEPPPMMPGQPPPDSIENTRLVVLGSADLASNDMVRFAQANEMMFLACVAWLAERASLISVPPKEPTQRPLTLSLGQKRFIQIFTMGVVPLAIAFVGFLVWFRRR
jgi:ABC-type uncharacterized transport system involved in gliding motility auxiliary subunit